MLCGTHLELGILSETSGFFLSELTLGIIQYVIICRANADTFSLSKHSWMHKSRIHFAVAVDLAGETFPGFIRTGAGQCSS
jgi:hypothetical protein